MSASNASFSSAARPDAFQRVLKGKSASFFTRVAVLSYF
jgi:hypothetical protein